MTSSMRRMGFLPERPNLLPVGTWELEATVIGRDIVPGAGVEGMAGWKLGIAAGVDGETVMGRDMVPGAGVEGRAGLNLGFGTGVDGEMGMGRVGILILIASFM